MNAQNGSCFWSRRRQGKAVSPGKLEEMMTTEAHLIATADEIEAWQKAGQALARRRNVLAVKLHREGASLAKVAGLARVTRGRVWQIVQDAQP